LIIYFSVLDRQREFEKKRDIEKCESVKINKKEIEAEERNIEISDCKQSNLNLI